ncbi:TonB-dependent receptor [Gluconobacter thailandicus]|uniref:TonB-dependent receptor family protein n=1 Tax=Gluconobacter thailandicus TaxID=257438 RepID=UPI000776FCF8|nr:TonB-dependent receptor [Gluconobacter thailandicus]KXV35634.1 TonB-dependent receptor [Gluconobacter thailandicus]
MKAFYERHTRILLLGMTVLSTCTMIPAAIAQDAERNKRSGPRAFHVGPTVSRPNTPAAPKRLKGDTSSPHSKSEDISVTGSNSVRTAEKRMRKVPGNFTIISNKEVEKGRSATLEDTLAFQPGIFAQATSGSTGNKISIRGSGAGVFYGGYSLGMKYLIDGLTVSGVGGFQEDRLNNTGYQRTEVLYGANAFDYAATALGGGINFVPHTGVSAPGFMARFEAGSYGTLKEQVSQGGTFSNRKGDYYVTVARTNRQGFQIYTAMHRTDVVANLGYRFTDKLSARLIFKWDEGFGHYGGLLTLAQLRKSPSINPNDWGGRPTRSTMLGFKTDYIFDDDSRLEYGITWNNYPLFNGTNTQQFNLWRSTDINNSVKYNRSDRLLGRNIESNFILSDVHMVSGDSRYYTSSVPSTTYNREDWTLHQRVKYGGSHDLVFAAGNNFNIFNRLWLTSGFSVIWVDRNIRVVDRLIPNSALQSREHYNNVFITPRVGLRYEINPDIDAFANFSRLIDPPVTWNYHDVKGGSPYNDTGTVGPLKAQRANSAEIGIRGHVGIFDGNLTLYRSWVKDELLSVVVTRATNTTAEITRTSNASPTIHQGIEAGLSTKLFNLRQYGALSFRQALTVNDFYYRHDSLLGQNKLPSIPTWQYQAELQYNNPLGFYANFDFRSSSSYYVDYANTLKAPRYGIFGLKLGYEAKSKIWSTFLDFRNLGNKHYATAAYTAYNLNHTDYAMFYPGDGFSVFGGVTVHLSELGKHF